MNVLNAKGVSWGVQFEAKYGNGGKGTFEERDVMMELGFQIRSCGCFPEQLALSLAHIYLEK
jgi:hypothetical protein